MAGFHFDERRLDLGALFEGLGTPRVEPAPRRREDEVGHRALDGRLPAGVRVHPGDGGKQTLGVWVKRVPEEQDDLCDLQNIPGVHPGDRVADLGDDGQLEG